MNPQKLKYIMAADVQDVPSLKEVADLLSALIKSVRDALKQTQDTMKSDMASNMKDCSQMCSSSSKKTLDEAYKALNSAIYGVEQSIKAIPTFNPSVLEKKWSLVVNDLQKNIDKWKQLNAVEIRDSLETLRGEERLDRSAIKGIDELEKSMALIDKKISNIPKGGGGMRKVPIIKRYNLSDQCNGVLKDFVLPQDTVDVLGIFGTEFPINFNPGTDWTFSGRTLTLTSGVSAPATGQTLYAIIETLFYG